mmetsp:Transcript_67530/g.188354  ORF Transcript_67530/g.188354 Transcript_67530/m.188354 type:complete len:448 (+) Transcript_67530:144-1487(+)
MRQPGAWQVPSLRASWSIWVAPNRARGCVRKSGLLPLSCCLVVAQTVASASFFSDSSHSLLAVTALTADLPQRWCFRHCCSFRKTRLVDALSDCRGASAQNGLRSHHGLEVGADLTEDAEHYGLQLLRAQLRGLHGTAVLLQERQERSLYREAEVLVRQDWDEGGARSEDGADDLQHLRALKAGRRADEQAKAAVQGEGRAARQDVGHGVGVAGIERLHEHVQDVANADCLEVRVIHSCENPGVGHHVLLVWHQQLARDCPPSDLHREGLQRVMRDLHGQDQAGANAQPLEGLLDIFERDPERCQGREVGDVLVVLGDPVVVGKLEVVHDDLEHAEVVGARGAYLADTPGAQQDLLGADDDECLALLPDDVEEPVQIDEVVAIDEGPPVAVGLERALEQAREAAGSNLVVANEELEPLLLLRVELQIEAIDGQERKREHDTKDDAYA